MFLHLSAMVTILFGLLISPFVSDYNPFSKEENPLLSGKYLNPAYSETQSLSSDDVFETKESQKPRDKIIDYTVQKGDTLSVISERFGISQDTVKWANDLKSDDITVGDTLKILPVTGIAHKVVRGDTVYSIAKKYDTNAQGIVDFPFNDFANPQAFSLVEGQILIVPEGVKPAEQPRYVRPKYIATGPANVPVGNAGFAWPTQGVISQFYSWYHQAIDIAASIGTPIVAAQSGQVANVSVGGWNGGYGTYVTIQGDNGYSTLYSHMSSVNVNPGDTVNAGKTVLGWIGMTGRTTGPHLHFEIRGAEGGYNPLSFLK